MRDPQFDEMLRFLAELKQGHCGDVKVINHLNVHPDSGRKTNAEPRGSGSESWSDFEVIKVEFLHEKFT
jgi:hypothetical protein